MTGELITSQQASNADFHDYYQELYSKPTPLSQYCISGSLSGISFSRLTTSQLDTVEEPLQVAEIHAAISQIAQNKTPGMDGLPIEYNATFSTQTTQHRLAMFNEAWDSSGLPDSLCEALIVILPKPGRNPLDVKSYRPLSLLNLDCNILHKVLTHPGIEASYSENTAKV
ncbi:hypothetical protein NDU88_006607 [Pleurodeles waltl]|uniref:Uncharacterized protein n=1 Tax=Pleurodeles waltl TaxID=8319 RepID=A0AAV7LPN3_PLEWA|nr:hypothetical protein NDU88_006607 [Pleurodeles waltl]